eukprot:TRINITY_DN9315_c0_g1_i2.p1 TRINITY_DN9315_c0_g1~~TRINITY_DN9315_c0_g1_i2.p1  ORF type:complete len:319 (-),score=52.60 TRINITY_DN9315_c0_g1_i2:417-1373(-)
MLPFPSITNFTIPTRSPLELPKEGCEIPKGLKLRPEGFRGSKAAQEMLQRGEPFLWMRFADADMIEFADFKSDTNSMEGMSRAAFFEWGDIHADRLFVSLGYWWLCDFQRNEKQRLWYDVDKLSRYQGRSMSSSFRGFSNEFYFPLVPNKSKPRTIGGVLPMLQNKTVYVLGPKYLNRLKVMLGHKGYLGECSFKTRTKVWQSIRNASAYHPRENVIFLVTCGTPGKLIMYRAFEQLGHKDSFLDIGTSLEPFSGTASRDYHNVAGLCTSYPDWMVAGVCVRELERERQRKEREAVLQREKEQSRRRKPMMQQRRSIL